MNLHVVMDQTSPDGGGGGGGAPAAPAPAPAPSAAPAAAVVPVAPASGGETSFVDVPKGTEPVGSEADDGTDSDLQKVFSDLASEDEGPGDVPAPVAKPVAQPAPRPAAQVQPAPAAPVQPAQPEAPVQPAAQVPPAQPAQPAQPAETEEQRQARIVEHRNKVVTDLATRYAVPEADVSELVTNPEKVLPKMMAQLHANVMDNVQQYIAGNFQRWTEYHQAVARTNLEGAERFYTEWPELRGAAHGPTVVRMLTAYRQANPQAKAEEVIREGGLAALVALKLPMPARLLGPGAHNVSLPEPTRPGAPPVHAGVAARAAPGKPEDNIFTILANEDLQN